MTTTQTRRASLTTTVCRSAALVAMLSALWVATPGAQEALTKNQRDADLVQLASTFAKQYAPYEWKRDVFGFDLFRLTPWLQRAHHADERTFKRR